jgi:hypothetical protein
MLGIFNTLNAFGRQGRKLRRRVRIYTDIICRIEIDKRANREQREKPKRHIEFSRHGNHGRKVGWRFGDVSGSMK